MNLWLILLFALPILGFLVFGKNPLREWQKEQREIVKVYGSNEETITANYYAQQKQKTYGLGERELSTGDMKSLMRASGTPDAVDPQIGAIQVNPIMSGGLSGMSGNFPGMSGNSVAPPDDQFPDDVNNYVEVTSRPDVINNMRQYQQPNNQQPKILYSPPSSQASQLTNSSYYPPIISDKVSNPDDQIPSMILTGKEYRLRSGQIIAFEGVNVFLVDRIGRRSNMPDGEYYLQDGGRIKVRGGRNISSN
ncbi:MAG: hypothetical protein ABL857_03450 [Rickettsiales bacterium]|jgi:hypothetical protein